jgi:hypothetical protein
MLAVAKLDAGRVVRITGGGVAPYITSTKRGEVREKRLLIHHKVCQLAQTLMLTVGSLGFRDPHKSYPYRYPILSASTLKRI